MKTSLTAFLIALSLAGCTTNTRTTLKNPQNGEIVTCDGKKTNMFSVGPVSVGSEDDTGDCMQKHLDKGFQRQSAIGGIFM